jgi:hypothetical protein
MVSLLTVFIQECEPAWDVITRGCDELYARLKNLAG